MGRWQYLHKYKVLHKYMGHQSMELTEMSPERSHMCSYAICLTSTVRMMDSLSLSRVTSNDDETDMLIPRRNFHTKKKEGKKIIQHKRNGVTGY